MLETRRKEKANISTVDEVKVSLDDVVSSLREVRPSAMKEVTLEVPKVRNVVHSSTKMMLPRYRALAIFLGQVLWSDIGGQEEVKICVRDAVELPITHPEVETRPAPSIH